MSRWRPDVVMSNGFHADVLARLAARHVGVSAVIAWRHGCGHRRRNGARDRVTERLTGRLVSRYFAVAENQVPYLTDELGLPEDKIRVIHNSVPLPTSRRTARDHAVAAATRPPTVAAISRLHEEKDHAVLLRAMRIVVDELPDAQLVIIGDGPMRHDLEALTRGLALANNVSFFGDRYDVATLLPEFDVLAISSYTIECSPYTVLEAMSAAVPVVATRVGGLSELVDDGRTGYLVEPKDTEALAARLIEILSDPKLGRAMGVAGQLRLADEFSFDKVIRQLEAEITQVASRSLIPYPR
jgi:glycosyltransferase involved in cell wall biosynthesis